MAPAGERKSLADRRWCICDILEIIWADVRPHLLVLHEQGVRSIDRKADLGDWLPLTE